MSHQLSPQQTQLVKQDQLHEAKVGLSGHCSTAAAGLEQCWRGPPDTFHGCAAGECQTPPLSAMLVLYSAAAILELLAASVRPLGDLNLC